MATDRIGHEARCIDFQVRVSMDTEASVLGDLHRRGSRESVLQAINQHIRYNPPIRSHSAHLPIAA